MLARVVTGRDAEPAVANTLARAYVQAAV